MQSKLFPQYFTVAVFAGILQMGTLAFGVPGGIARAQLLTLGEVGYAAIPEVVIGQQQSGV